MTRTRDTLVALADRGRIANAQRGDLFVSVHVNAANPGWRDPAAARGFETYFLSDARTEDARQVAERENESVRYEAGGEHRRRPAPVHRQRSSRRTPTCARRVGSRRRCSAGSPRAPGPDRGVHQAGFKVLVTASMPAVLVEAGFGSNPEEAAYLASARGPARDRRRHRRRRRRAPRSLRPDPWCRGVGPGGDPP
jgi:N-acetylmuramoyl-L-alanine amidase